MYMTKNSLNLSKVLTNYWGEKETPKIAQGKKKRTKVLDRKFNGQDP